jgi:hypothetical protein
MHLSELESHLNCSYDKRLARFFLWNQVPSLTLMLLGPALVGVITGTWWPLAVIAGGAVVLWGFGVETRLLCSHCPFYGAEGKTLRCLALDGFPKFWKYRPGPMSRLEKILLSSLVVFLLAAPLVTEGYGVWYLWAYLSGLPAILGMALVTLATALAEWQFAYVIRHDFCAHCINFSCPLNSVPKEIRDVYLKQHPALRQAWEQSGYQLD